MSEGPGRVLVALYSLFALAAGARAAVQLATRLDVAPFAYALSAAAAAVYLLAALAIAHGRRRLALGTCGVELAGVLVVGTLTLADRGLFADDTVGSGYGSGYGYVPLVLPVLGLLYLTQSRPRAAPRGRTPTRRPPTAADPRSGASCAATAEPRQGAPGRG